MTVELLLLPILFLAISKIFHNQCSFETVKEGANLEKPVYFCFLEFSFSQM